VPQVPDHLRRRNDELLEKRSFFGSHIACFVPENSLCESEGGCYFTEKLFEAVVTGSIPFYYGCRDVLKIFHHDRVIMVHNTSDAVSKMREFLGDFAWIDRAYSSPILAPTAESYLMSLQSAVLLGFSHAISLRGIHNMTG
jgi:hypothetical protein